MFNANVTAKEPLFTKKIIDILKKTNKRTCYIITCRWYIPYSDKSSNLIVQLFE